MGRDLIGRQTVKLEFDVRLDTAENLVKYGPSLIRILEAAITSARHAIKNAEYDDTRELREQARRERMAEVLRDGRHFHRAFRRQLRDLQCEDLSRGREFARQQIISTLAGKFGAHRDYVQVAIKHHRKSYSFKLRERRRRYALEYFLAGLSRKEISTRIHASVTLVGQFIREFEAEANDRNITLEDLLHAKSIQALVNRLANLNDQKVIRLEDLGQADGPGATEIQGASQGQVLDWQKIRSTKSGTPI